MNGNFWILPATDKSSVSSIPVQRLPCERWNFVHQVECHAQCVHHVGIVRMADGINRWYLGLWITGTQNWVGQSKCRPRDICERLELTEYNNAIHWSDALQQWRQLAIFDVVEPFLNEIVYHTIDSKQTASIVDLLQFYFRTIQLTETHYQAHDWAVWHLNAFSAIIDCQFNFGTECDAPAGENKNWTYPLYRLTKLMSPLNLTWNRLGCCRQQEQLSPALVFPFPLHRRSEASNFDRPFFSPAFPALLAYQQS